MQKAFNKMKSIFSTDTMIAPPYHNELYILFTDASDYEVEAVIMQIGSGCCLQFHKLC